MNSRLLSYYEAIEKASADMLDAARTGNWDHVIKLEGACVDDVRVSALATLTVARCFQMPRGALRFSSSGPNS